MSAIFSIFKIRNSKALNISNAGQNSGSCSNAESYISHNATSSKELIFTFVRLSTLLQKPRQQSSYKIKQQLQGVWQISAKKLQKKQNIKKQRSKKLTNLKACKVCHGGRRYSFQKSFSWLFTEREMTFNKN